MISYIPEEKIHKLCSAIDGNWGIYLSVPETGEKMAVNADRQIISASTIKVPLLALLLRDGEEGRLDLHAPMPIQKENRVNGSGVLQGLDPNVTMSLFDYAVLMMVLSDNIATNQVIDAVGMDRANAFFRQNGWSATRLQRKMMTPGEQNYTSVKDLADMMERILAGTLVSEQASRTMLSIMAGQVTGKFRPALPAVKRPNPETALAPIPSGKVLLAAKSGTLFHPNAAHDAGIMILPNGRRAVLVMTTCTGDNAKAESIMGQVARTVYKSLL